MMNLPKLYILSAEKILALNIMSARKARAVLADARAMEEQEERENPLNPKKQIGAEKGYVGILKGSGATPSMGLSQFRGGAVQKSEDSDSDDEAYGLGKHLGSHLLGQHGGAYHAKFLKGMGKAHSLLDHMEDPSAKIGGATMIGAGRSGAYEGEGSADMEGCGTKKGMVRKTARLAYEGEGMLGQNKKGTRRTKDEMGTLTTLTGTPMSGAGMKVPTTESRPFGKPPKVKRMVGAGDGRRKRAEVVKKVMSEKGLSMIDASKYVKEHNLY